MGSVAEDASSGTDEGIVVAADAEPTWLPQTDPCQNVDAACWLKTD